MDFLVFWRVRIVLESVIRTDLQRRAQKILKRPEVGMSDGLIIAVLKLPITPGETLRHKNSIGPPFALFLNLPSTSKCNESSSPIEERSKRPGNPCSTCRKLAQGSQRKHTRDQISRIIELERPRFLIGAPSRVGNIYI